MAAGATDKQLQLLVEGQQRSDNNNKKQQSTNDWWQRQRMTMAGKRQGAVVDVEEQLLCGSRGETAPQ